jgi:hypothetical protein
LTDFPSGCSVTQSLNAADDLVSGNTRQSQTGISSYHRSRIRVTDATCFHANPNLARTGLRNRSFDNAKTAGRRDFDCFIGFCHLNLPLTFCISRDASSCIVVKLHFRVQKKNSFPEVPAFDVHSKARPKSSSRIHHKRK